MSKKTLPFIIPEHILNTQKFSNYSVTVYGVLKSLVNMTGNAKQCINEYQIMYFLTENIYQSKHTIKCVKQALEELICEKEIIKIAYFNKHYILDCSNFWCDTKNEKFTVVTVDELTSIFKIQNTNNFILMRYYVFLISTLMNKTTVYVNADSKSRVVGTYTIEKLSQLSGISVRSIIEYNKLLEDNRLIYIHRQNDFILDEEDHIRQLPNVYGRYCDKAYIDSFAENQKKHQESYRYQEKSIVKVNDNRRLAQMYNQILKGYGERYSESEISDIYSYVLTQNKKYERLYDKYSKEEYLDKIRDTDIFIQYGF